MGLFGNGGWLPIDAAPFDEDVLRWRAHLSVAGGDQYNGNKADQDRGRADRVGSGEVARGSWKSRYT
jgi:hypothetical protein